QDWRHRAPRGAVADLPAAGADVGAEEGAGAVGSRASAPRPRLPRSVYRGWRQDAGAQGRLHGGRAGTRRGFRQQVMSRSMWAAVPGFVVAAAILVASGSSPALAGGERVIHVTAKKFEFDPSTIELKVGEVVILEIKTADRRHGFKVPELNL